MTDHELDYTQYMIFFRAGDWFAIPPVKGVPLAQQAADHAELNPGTLRIEDMNGNVLWRLQ